MNTNHSHILVPVSPLVRAAIAVLTGDGSTPRAAIQQAIVAQAELFTPEPGPVDAIDDDDVRVELGAARLVAAAPPLTPYQKYVIRTVFVDRREFFLDEEQWRRTADCGPL